MNQYYKVFACAILLSSFFFGCATGEKVSVTSGTTKIDKRVAQQRVELPGGYDVDDFRRLRVGIGYGAIQSNCPAFKGKDNKDYMNLRFQSEMDKHKRFKFIALYGANSATFDALTDAGEMEANDDDDSARYQRPDINLTWNINIQEESKPNGSYSQKLIFKCTVNATASYYGNVMKKDKSGIKHNKGDVAFTKDFDLPIIVKTQNFNAMGGLKSGFNFRSDADVQGLMQEIIIAASQRIASDLGRRFPVGGKVTNALGTGISTLRINKGAEQGVEKDMPMVIFARCDGIDIALANALATPAQDYSTLKVVRMANDKDAASILAEINGRKPLEWAKETGNELFAVRAVPVQDEQKGTRFE